MKRLILFLILLAVPAWAANDTSWSTGTIAPNKPADWAFDSTGQSPILFNACPQATLYVRGGGTVDLYYVRMASDESGSSYVFATHAAPVEGVNERTGAYGNLQLNATDDVARNIEFDKIVANVISGSGVVFAQCTRNAP